MEKLKSLFQKPCFILPGAKKGKISGFHPTLEGDWKTARFVKLCGNGYKLLTKVEGILQGCRMLFNLSFAIDSYDQQVAGIFHADGIKEIFYRKHCAIEEPLAPGSAN